MKRFLLIDLGNVLIDLDFKGFVEFFENQTGHRPNLANGALHQQYMKGQFSEEAMVDHVNAELGLDLSSDTFVQLWARMLGPDRIYLRDLLNECQTRFELALCSNTDATHVEILKERHSPMIEGFDHYCYSFTLGEIKPDTSYFEKVLAQLDAEAAECYFLDDNLDNVLSARALGIEAFHVPDIMDVEIALSELVQPV
jgi:HAD superfamily hydrolase (TIGR01509 family)